MSSAASKRKSVSQVPSISINDAKKLDQLPKALCRMRVKYDFEKENADEIELKKGEIIDVNVVDVDGDEGWGRGFNLDTKMYGIFPIDFCTLVVSQIPKPQRGGEIYDANDNYTPREGEEDCVALLRGEFVEVLPLAMQDPSDLSEGWTKIYNFSTQLTGMVPTTHITKIVGGGTTAQGGGKRPRLSVYGSAGGASMGSLAAANSNQIVDLKKGDVDPDFEKLGGVKYFRIKAKQTPEFDEDLDLNEGDYIQTSLKSKFDPLYYGCKVGTTTMGFVDIELCIAVTEEEAKNGPPSANTPAAQKITLRKHVSQSNFEEPPAEEKSNSGRDPTAANCSGSAPDLEAFVARINGIENRIKGVEEQVLSIQTSPADKSGDDVEKFEQFRAELRADLEALRVENAEIRKGLEQEHGIVETLQTSVDSKISDAASNAQQATESQIEVINGAIQVLLPKHEQLELSVVGIRESIGTLESSLASVIERSTRPVDFDADQVQLAVAESQCFQQLSQSTGAIRQELATQKQELQDSLECLRSEHSQSISKAEESRMTVDSALANLEAQTKSNAESVLELKAANDADREGAMEKVNLLREENRAELDKFNQSIAQLKEEVKQAFVSKSEFATLSQERDAEIKKGLAAEIDSSSAVLELRNRVSDIAGQLSEGGNKNDQGSAESDSRLKNLEEQVKSLTERLEESNRLDQSSQVAASNAEDKERLGRLENAIKSMEGHYETYGKALKLLKEKMVKSAAEMDEKLNGLQKSGEDKAKSSSDSSALAAEIRDSTTASLAKIDGLASQITKIESHLSTQDAKITSLESGLSETKAASNSASQASGSGDDESQQKMAKAIRNLAEKLIDLETTVKNLSGSGGDSDTLKDLKENFNKFKEETSSNIKAFSRRVTSMKAQMQDLAEAAAKK